MSHQTQLIMLDSKYKYKMRLICNVSINIFPFTVKHSFFFSCMVLCIVFVGKPILYMTSEFFTTQL